MTSTKHYKYDIVISYAAEDRAYADALAKDLLERKVKIFYDKYEQVDLWGKNLYTHLSDLYQNKARYCIMFISKHYATKLWTNHERQVVQARAFKENEEYILPIRLDDTEIPGIVSTVAYLRCPPETPETIADAILKKLGRSSQVPIISDSPSDSLPPTQMITTVIPHVQNSSAIGIGDKILEAIKMIIQKSNETTRKLHYPGEGGERPFRNWLTKYLLEKLFDWPTDKIVIGERFDILLVDSDGFPVATIETKSPGHKASKQERKDFEARLSDYGTLRTAYLTNGTEWERLDIHSPTGELEIRDRSNFYLDKATTEEAEGFFIPLLADRYFQQLSRTTRHAVNSENTHILQTLAADLDQGINELSSLFEREFLELRAGKAGDQARDVLLNLFDLWCDKSLIVSPRKAGEHLLGIIEKQELAPQNIDKAITEFGWSGPQVNSVLDAIKTFSKTKPRDLSTMITIIWPIYVASIKNLCAQTAHVVMARALLYRIGEDLNIFPRMLSDKALDDTLKAPVPSIISNTPPATTLLSNVRLSMQSFLPTVYMLGEFDWWLITPDKRAVLSSTNLMWLQQIDKEFEQKLQRLLRMLNGYFFGRVDVDVWRNVYQHYLPSDVRQRLGGFYTPDELINPVLDLIDFKTETIGLCTLSFIDPACGSGAFVTSALNRLLTHFQLDLPCHPQIHNKGLPEWKRAEEILNITMRNLHGVDIHPFAAFLTTINSLFMLLPLYVKVRERNPDFSLDLHIFASDSLEKHDEDLIQPDLFARLNSRVQLTEDAFHRYQELLRLRFDRIFGNPPWGGILKGSLAPIYDEAKKKRFTVEYPAAARGKYDIYGLFMERALQMLRLHGSFGLVTQDTYLDKEWAANLRKILVDKAKPLFIIDLNPFGQLFFHAMNTPCITIVEQHEDVNDREECIAILSTSPKNFKGMTRNQRLTFINSTIRDAINQETSIEFAQFAKLSIQYLRKTAAEGWNLSIEEPTIPLKKNWLSVVDILEMRQGVTPGGFLELFLMSEDAVNRLEIEQDLVHPAIKSKEIERWHLEWTQRVLLYPYLVTARGAMPAFTIDLLQIENKELAEVIRQIGLKDALDFNKQIDKQENQIVRGKGVNKLTVEHLLSHRVALGLVRYPKAAAYLVQHYEQLEGRVFEKTRFTDLGKQWYEYHRPRDPKLILSKNRIVSPSLVKQLRFASDTIGYLSDHACIYLQPTTLTSRGYRDLQKQMAEALERDCSLEDILNYCLAFLNSSYAQKQLTDGYRPTPKGFYAVTKKSLSRILISPPPNKEITTSILDLVSKLVNEPKPEKRKEMEVQLEKIIFQIAERS